MISVQILLNQPDYINNFKNVILNIRGYTFAIDSSNQMIVWNVEPDFSAFLLLNLSLLGLGSTIKYARQTADKDI